MLNGQNVGAKNVKKKHLTRTDGEKPYHCDTQKEFSRKSSLKTHNFIQTGNKPHVCDVCEKVFRKKQLLKEQQRVHTGEKPYVCDTCDKKAT